MKKKILITQPQFTKHQVFDESVLDILKKKYDVVFINRKKKIPVYFRTNFINYIYD